MPDIIRGWRQPETEQTSSQSESSEFRQAQTPSMTRTKQSAVGVPSQRSGIWFNPDLSSHEATANLDSLSPATLYYLGRIISIEVLCKVYVEQRPDGCQKHWAVLKERDYEAMDEIYNIEEATLDSFPLADLTFRVTVDTEGGPSVSESAVKVYDID